MRRIIISVIILMISSLIFGQQTKNKINFGIEGGPCMATLWGKGINENYNESVIDYLGLFALQFNNSGDNSSAYINIGYERKGHKALGYERDEFGNIVGNAWGKGNLDYLTGHLLVRFTHKGKVNYFFNLGPFFSYLLKQNYIMESTHVSKFSYDFKTFQHYDFGFSTGIGVQIPIKEYYIFTFEVRDNLGIINIFKNYNPVQILPIKTNTTNIQFGILYKIGTIK